MACACRHLPRSLMTAPGGDLLHPVAALGTLHPTDLCRLRDLRSNMRTITAPRHPEVARPGHPQARKHQIL